MKTFWFLVLVFGIGVWYWVGVRKKFTKIYLAPSFLAESRETFVPLAYFTSKEHWGGGQILRVFPRLQPALGKYLSPGGGQVFLFSVPAHCWGPQTIYQNLLVPLLSYRV